MMRLQSTGPKNLITDIDGLRVGNASDERLKSGVTVLTADQPFAAAMHVMGGAPGTRETDLLAPDKMVSAIDALVLSGGSAHGLDAASGVMARLHQSGRGFAVGDQTVPIVPAAILFDLLNGGDKAWDNNPYAGLGGLELRFTQCAWKPISGLGHPKNRDRASNRCIRCVGNIGSFFCCLHPCLCCPHRCLRF